MHAIETHTRTANRMEHRWGQRVTLEVPVRLDIGTRSMVSGLLRNASISGALIETAVELPLYSTILVNFPQLNDAAPAPGLPARMVRRAPGGFAVEWRDMECPQIVALLEKISGRAGASLRGDDAFD